MTQEDMIDHEFSLRHYQQIEAGSSINVTTLLRLADAFDLDVVDLLSNLMTEARDAVVAERLRHADSTASVTSASGQENPEHR